ncbi:MAG: sporulation protein YabP [Lachnospiraceae bacterium]|jgi:sporulation protein YabP|nr:sporulation protein YabP [Lachnospiraceae bacterium]
MEERTGTGGGHKLMISNRKSGVLNGVIDVLSFDVGEVLLETELGMLMIKGNDLHVNRLTLEKGEIDIEGKIDSLTYSDVKPSAKQNESLLGRLFK